MAKSSPELPRFRPTSSPPPTRPASVKSFRSDSISGSTAVDDDTASVTYPSRVSSPIEYFLDWLLKVLGVAAAILFGIWAPVSYRAQASGNASSDQAQGQLVEKVEELREEVEDMKRRMDGLAMLRVWEACAQEGRRDLSACKSLLGNVALNDILANLAAPAAEHNPLSQTTTSSKTLAMSISTPRALPTTNANSEAASVISRATDVPPSITWPTHVSSGFPVETGSDVPSPTGLEGGDVETILRVGILFAFMFTVVLAVLCMAVPDRGVRRDGQRKRRDDKNEMREDGGVDRVDEKTLFLS